MPTVKADDLAMAEEWVSGDIENGAWVCRETGKIYWKTGDPGMVDDEDEELPEDIHDESKYVPVPGKYDLDLGNELAYAFAKEFLPDDYDHVRGIFRRKGAWSRFKDLLERKGLLEEWYAYSDRREVEALVEWGEANGLDVERPQRQKPQPP
jgi:hypothetical protein